MSARYNLIQKGKKKGKKRRRITISEGYLSSILPHTRCGANSTRCPCSLDPDWCLRSDLMTIFTSSGLTEARLWLGTERSLTVRGQYWGLDGFYKMTVDLTPKLRQANLTRPLTDPHPEARSSPTAGTRASTSFWTIPRVFPSRTPPLTRHAACSPWCPCGWGADWC